MWAGTWPDKDHTGKKFDANSLEGKLAGSSLAGGFYCAMWSFKGDLEFFCQSLGLQNPGCGQPCNLCRANLKELPWTNFSRRPAWEASVWTQASWEAAHPEHVALFDIPG
eukprot:13026633-Alexandrium_andersonii.AAC.1